MDSSELKVGIGQEVGRWSVVLPEVVTLPSGIHFLRVDLFFGFQVKDGRLEAEDKRFEDECGRLVAEDEGSE